MPSFVKNTLPFLFLVPLLLFLASCDVAEPSRYFAAETTSAKYGVFVFENYDTTMTLDGVYTIRFRLDSANFEIRSLSYNLNMVQEKYVQPINGVYSITVDCSQFPTDSSYNLKLSIVPAKNGLISALNVKMLTRQLPVRLHTGKLLTANLNSLTLNDYPVLTWDKCKDNLFKSYSILRNINHIWDTIAVIRSADTCSYIDKNIPPIYGVKAISYKLIVQNNSKSIESTELNTAYNNCCTVLPFNKYIFSAYLPVPGMGLIADFNQNGLEHYDLNLNKKLSGSGLPSSPEGLTLSKDGSRIFMKTNSNDAIYVLNYSNTVSNPKIVSVNGQNAGLLDGFIEIRPGLLFLTYTEVVMGQTFPRTAYYDCASGILSRHYQALPDLATYKLHPSIDDNIIYGQQQDKLYRMDFSDTANINITTIGSFTILKGINELSRDRKVFYTFSDLTVYDRNFNFAGRYTSNNRNQRLFMGKNICVIVSGNYNYAPYLVEVVDLSNFQVLKSAIINASINCVLIYPDGSVIVNATEFTQPGTFERYLKLN